MDAFKLYINLEDMVVKLIACPPMPDTLHDVEGVRTALRENNILKGIDFTVMEQAFIKLPELPEGEEFVIARGKPASHGVNGRIDFLVNVSGKATYDVDHDSHADKKIDYRNAVKIESVKPGQDIAKIIPPTTGTPGFNLTGKELPAKNGKPVVYRLGEGVQLDTDGCTVRAMQEGRPLFSHRIISVNPVYEVHGDVCYETGNIKFDGYVSISGNVLDDFIVEAKNIEIHGIIGAATIRCQNNLVVHGGVNGHNRADVVCRGGADIKYVNAAKIEVRGDLNIAREIVNSTVWCGGKLVAGKILGGTSIALHGITAQVFGSDLGIPTLVEPGINYEIRRIDEAIETISGQIGKVVNPIRGFLGDHRKFLQFPPEKQQELRDNYDYFCRLRSAYDKLHYARRKIMSTDNSKPVKEVIVLKHLFPDVTIRTGSCVRQFRTEVNGPAALLEDIANGTIRVLGYNPSKGKVIEEAEKDK